VRPDPWDSCGDCYGRGSKSRDVGLPDKAELVEQNREGVEYCRLATSCVELATPLLS
jgi:hypothetical protein